MSHHTTVLSDRPETAAPLGISARGHAAPGRHPHRTMASPDGIGDITSAGQETAYPHLRAHRGPTVGRLMAAARRAAELLASPEHRAGPAEGWRTLGGDSPGTVTAAALTLLPNEFAHLPPEWRRSPVGGVLYLADGRAHLVALSREGRLLSVQDVAAHRGRLLAGTGEHQVINTGDEAAVLVFATARPSPATTHGSLTFRN